MSAEVAYQHLGLVVRPTQSCMVNPRSYPNNMPRALCHTHLLNNSPDLRLPKMSSPLGEGPFSNHNNHNNPHLQRTGTEVCIERMRPRVNLMALAIVVLAFKCINSIWASVLRDVTPSITFVR